MAAAYEYADGGRKPMLSRMHDAIREYGAEAIAGRVLGYREVVRMEYISAVKAIIRDRDSAENVAAWATEHPDWVELLDEASAQAVKYAQCS